MATLNAITSIRYDELRDLLTYAYERGRESVTERYISIAAAARETGLSRPFIQEAIDRGELICSRLGNRRGCKNQISTTHLRMWVDTNSLKPIKPIKPIIN